MKFEELVELVGQEPVFATGMLLAGDVDPADIRRQLSRWTRSGRVMQLRRGLYVLAPAFRKLNPHPFLVANRMVRGSYVSCQSALSAQGLVPEHVPVVTSVTTGRPASWDNSLGRFVYRHLKSDLFFGYASLDLGNQQQAFVARPEKALLDLVHLEVGGDKTAYIEALRLQNLDSLELEKLDDWAQRTGKPKLLRAAAVIARLTQEQAEEYKNL